MSAIVWQADQNGSHVTTGQKIEMRRRLRRRLERSANADVYVHYVRDGLHDTFSVSKAIGRDWLEITEHGLTKSEEIDMIGYLMRRLFSEVVIELNSLAVIKIEAVSGIDHILLCKTGTSRQITGELFEQKIKGWRKKGAWCGQEGV